MSTPPATHRVEIGAAHPAFDGHFPGQPVLPGVALLAEVLEAAFADPALAACVGAAPRLPVVKFLAPVRPGASLRIAFRVGARALDWDVREGERIVASGRIARADVAVSASP
jgi:3-hydroxymyristoyl/3-hydroxydecanoyl-(acyl carrier protein) dehydratase